MDPFWGFQVHSIPYYVIEYFLINRRKSLQAILGSLGIRNMRLCPAALCMHHLPVLYEVFLIMSFLDAGS